MIRVAALALCLLGCASQAIPGAKVLPDKYGQPYQGVRAAAPDLHDGEKRLDIFLGVVVEPVDEQLDEQASFKEVIYCVALNEDEDPLPEVASLIGQTPADRLIYVWGKPIQEKRGFWWDGVDCAAEALAVWHPKARKYVYFDLVYGRPIWRWTVIRGALKKAVEGGTKGAVKVILPR